MARQAYDWLSLTLLLDLKRQDWIIPETLEIGLTDAAGQVVFETRLKPTVAIGAQAAAVHRISAGFSAAHHHGQMWRGNCVMQSGTDQ